ncbi:hypothetical protein EVAR_50231_1 [Eumeta japonica]|uniref:Uncharacterized protein n=1 Tax=Eumeta variegata TaxID=151549 RepID=A0A4C2A8E4_EUMVA|nr:hypothetical protein EVAR_50231_1 [Eumeta japonica]
MKLYMCLSHNRERNASRHFQFYIRPQRVAARDSRAVTKADAFVYLTPGLTLDNKLQWSPHIGELAKRLISAAFAIKKIRKSDIKTARLVYFGCFHTLMHTAFCFGDVLWMFMFTEFSFCKSELFAQFTGWDLVFLSQKRNSLRESSENRALRLARFRTILTQGRRADVHTESELPKVNARLDSQTLGGFTLACGFHYDNRIARSSQVGLRPRSIAAPAVTMRARFPPVISDFTVSEGSLANWQPYMRIVKHNRYVEIGVTVQRARREGVRRAVTWGGRRTRRATRCHASTAEECFQLLRPTNIINSVVSICWIVCALNIPRAAHLEVYRRRRIVYCVGAPERVRRTETCRRGRTSVSTAAIGHSSHRRRGLDNGLLTPILDKLLYPLFRSHAPRRPFPGAGAGVA